MSVRSSVVLSYRRRKMPYDTANGFGKHYCKGLNYSETDNTSDLSNEPKYGACAWAWEIKESMIEAGWEVYRSCDGAQISTSDLWTTRAFQKHMILSMWEAANYGMSSMQSTFGPEMIENNIWCCLRRTDADGHTLHVCIVPKLAWSGNARVENYRNTKITNNGSGDYGQHYDWPSHGSAISDWSFFNTNRNACFGTYNYSGAFRPAIMLGISSTEMTGGVLARAVPPAVDGAIIGQPRVIGDINASISRGYYMKGGLPDSETGVMWVRPLVLMVPGYSSGNTSHYINTFVCPYLDVICYEGNQIFIDCRRNNESYTWRNWIAITKFDDGKGAHGWAATGPKGVSPILNSMGSNETDAWMTSSSVWGSTESRPSRIRTNNSVYNGDDLSYGNSARISGFANSSQQSSSSFAGDMSYFPEIRTHDQEWTRSSVNANGVTQWYCDCAVPLSEMEHGKGSDFVMIDKDGNHRCGYTAGPDLRAPRSLNGKNAKGEIIRSVPFSLSAAWFCDGTHLDVYNDTLDGGKYPDDDLMWLGYYDDALLITSSQLVNNFSEVDGSKYHAYRSGYGSLLIRKPSPFEVSGDLGINLLTDGTSNVDWNPQDGTIKWDEDGTGSVSGDTWKTKTGLT